MASGTSSDAPKPLPVEGSSSFIRAMGQLNMQHPPSASRMQAYQRSQANAASNASGSSPQSQLAGVQSKPSVPSWRNAKFFLELTTKLTAQVIMDWVPHNMPPQEIHECREVTRTQLERIKSLEAEAERTAPMVELHVEKALFLARTDYRIHFSRIFRINELPTEIINNVFRFVVWSALEPTHGIKARLWLTWTCRLWRSLAVADPVLWNAIWFKDWPDFERSFAWLERAGDSPIDLRINDTKERPMSMVTMQNILQKVMTKISNIRIIIVVLQEWDPLLLILHAFRAVAENRCPMILERFEMHRCGSPYVQIGTGYEPSFYANPTPLFGGAAIPSFNYLSLNGIHLDWGKSILTNLTTIDLRRIPLERAPTLSQFRALLAGSPVLTKLILDGAGPQWHGDALAGLKPILIPSLRFLVLGDFSLSYGIFIFSQMSVPNVVDLTLMNLVGEDYGPLYDLMRSNLPSTKVLTLFNADLVANPQSAISIIRWLQSMPLVTYLRVGNVKKQFLDLFLMSSINPHSLEAKAEPTKYITCPNLAYLEFQAVEPDIISRFADIRGKLGGPLRKIYMSVATASRVTQEQHQRLAAALGKDGTVQILGPGGRPVEEVELVKS
ncbi:hypothetical protein B0H34DRAFT_23864 [Crassisporium funariophilum]|nr:hypothetical protein B0H34DRAFT_23864 [Crassisporium funariophilum]